MRDYESIGLHYRLIINGYESSPIATNSSFDMENIHPGSLTYENPNSLSELRNSKIDTLLL